MVKWSKFDFALSLSLFSSRQLRDYLQNFPRVNWSTKIEEKAIKQAISLYFPHVTFWQKSSRKTQSGSLLKVRGSLLKVRGSLLKVRVKSLLP